MNADRYIRIRKAVSNADYCLSQTHDYIMNIHKLSLTDFYIYSKLVPAIGLLITEVETYTYEQRLKIYKFLDNIDRDFHKEIMSCITYTKQHNTVGSIKTTDYYSALLDYINNTYNRG